MCDNDELIPISYSHIFHDIMSFSFFLLTHLFCSFFLENKLFRMQTHICERTKKSSHTYEYEHIKTLKSIQIIHTNELKLLSK